MKRPSFQFYPSDWMVDPGLSTLDYFHTGVFIRLLCFAFQTGGELRYCDGSEPLTITDLANLLGLEANQTKKVIDTLIKHGCLKVREDDGCLYNARMVRDCIEAKEFYEAKKRASEAGVEARRRIRESNENQASNSGTTKKEPVVDVWLNQKTTPSSSSSSSINNTTHTAHARENRLPSNLQEAIDFCTGTGVPESFIRERAWPKMEAYGFMDQGNKITNWAKWVTLFWNASENARKRAEKEAADKEKKQQKKRPDSYMYDDKPVREITL